MDNTSRWYQQYPVSVGSELGFCFNSSLLFQCQLYMVTAGQIIICCEIVIYSVIDYLHVTLFYFSLHSQVQCSHNYHGGFSNKLFFPFHTQWDHVVQQRILYHSKAAFKRDFDEDFIVFSKPDLECDSSFGLWWGRWY